MTQMPRRHGFTLIELLVVLVLAAIAVGVVGGGAQAFMGRSQYHQAVRLVASQLGQARSLSVQQGRSVAVRYSPSARALQVDGQAPLQFADTVDVQWQPLPSDAQAGGSDAAVIFMFNADGGARGGALAVLRGEQGRAFGVNRLLGTVVQSPVSRGG